MSTCVVVLVVVVGGGEASARTHVRARKLAHGCRIGVLHISCPYPLQSADCSGPAAAGRNHPHPSTCPSCYGSASTECRPRPRPSPRSLRRGPCLVRSSYQYTRRPCNPSCITTGISKLATEREGGTYGNEHGRGGRAELTQTHPG
jgi:hypothetical protein